MKKEIRDIVPKKELRTIRNIPIPPRIEPRKPKSEDIEIPIKKFENDREFPDNPKKHIKSIWIIATIAVIVLFFVVTAVFGNASIDVGTKQVTFDVPQNITAKQNPGTGEIGYSVVTLSEQNGTFIPGTSQKEVSTSASGQIVIYNNTSSSQTLIKTTRFENSDSDGLIFRLNSEVTVPARTISGGKTIPGSITAAVTADQPGSKYNEGLIDLNVVAFKGTSKYTEIYARSKTPLAGGEIGTVPVVDSDSMNSASTNLENKIATDLTSKISKQLPGKFVIPDGAYQINFSTSTSATSTDGLNLEMSGTITAYALDTKSIFESISSETQNDPFSNSDVKVLSSNLKTISYNEASSTLTMDLNGSLTIDAAINPADVLKAALGKSKEDALQAVQNIPGVDTVRINLTPIWKLKIPDDSSKISINIK